MKPEKLSTVFDGIGNVVGYYPDVRHIAGSINAAIYLCQVYYWGHETEDGWVVRSQREIEESTGLSRREQETAKSLLIEHGLVEEQCKGRNNKTHLKLNREAAIAAWNRYLETGVSIAESRKQKRSKSTKTNLKKRTMAETDKVTLSETYKVESDRSNPYTVGLAQNRQTTLSESDYVQNRQTTLSETDTSLCTLQTNPLYIEDLKDLSLRGKTLERESQASQIGMASQSESDRNLQSTTAIATQRKAPLQGADELGSGSDRSAAEKLQPRKINRPPAVDHFSAHAQLYPNGDLPVYRTQFDKFHPGMIQAVHKSMPDIYSLGNGAPNEYKIIRHLKKLEAGGETESLMTLWRMVEAETAKREEIQRSQAIYSEVTEDPYLAVVEERKQNAVAMGEALARVKQIMNAKREENARKWSEREVVA